MNSIKKKGVTALLALTLGATAIAVPGCSSLDTGAVPPPTNLPAQTVQVNVFFATGRSLVEEHRVVDPKDKYAQTLKKVLSADPQVNNQIAIVQPTAKFRSVKFENGLITVDWDRAILDFQAQPKEKVIAWASFLETFGQFPEVQKLKFTVEGKTSGVIGGKDIANFWGTVSLKGQPWTVRRPPDFVPATKAPASTPATASTKAAPATKK